MNENQFMFDKEAFQWVAKSRIENQTIEVRFSGYCNKFTDRVGYRLGNLELAVAWCGFGRAAPSIGGRPDAIWCAGDS